MPIVDSHCHTSDCWYEPVESLLFQMDANGVEKAILIQMMGQYDNGYQAACVRRYPDRLASVVIVDTERPDAVEQLEREKERGAAGLRLRPTARSAGDDPLAIWRAAERLGLSVSCGGTGPEFAAPAFGEVVESVPRLKIVIEHLGSVGRPDDDVAHALRRKVFGLARYPNTCIKIHGLGEFCRRAMPVPPPDPPGATAFPFVQPIPSALEAAYDAFGAGRMMWGSDYPPVSGREGYRHALRLTMRALEGKSDEERSLIFGQVALTVFPV
ncbi:MAG TPA: amidohydrolase family protein [Chloroflexota bacterium]|nr:amidohydrolase family protein [Chloroflexota bacterium]